MNKFLLLSLIAVCTLPACCLRKNGCKPRGAEKAEKAQQNMEKEVTKKAAPVKKKISHHSTDKLKQPQTKSTSGY